MVKKLAILFFAATTLVTACSFSKKPEKEQKTVSIDTVQITQNQKPIWYDGEIPFTFDVKNDYPETKIKLSDLSDALYIPLGTNDTTLLRLLGTCEGNEYFITDDLIYVHETEKAIYVFKKDGTPVRKIDRRGAGPEEYPYLASYAVDTLHNELFILDAARKRTLVYDLEGNFKRTFPNLAKEIGILNDSLLINYYRYNPGGPRYAVTRKTDGTTVKKLPIRFNVKLPHDSHGRMAYGSLIKSPKGFFLSNLANDTINEIQENMQLRPRIIDESNYSTTFAQVHPTIETGRYLMFYILCSHNYKPAVKQNFYIYDKKERQIYRMSDYPGNNYWRLLDDYPHITNLTTTQNSNIAIRTRLVESLFMEEGRHGDDAIKKLMKTLDIDDNPVLQVMIFHDVDKVLK